ncbi:hypothetical protein Q4I30_004835 [Leishmania utingensis]|uniref:Uncharacterized protein n=1 Tax=Leishmania utingensis TaxID=653362 RepID=A0AAW3AD40_9TRYP
MADDMPLSEQEKLEALGEVNLAGSSDMDRMIAESEERWRNRPRVIPTEDMRGFKISEPRVCRLPNGGVSAGVIAQLQRNRAAREAEKKEERQEPNIEL